MQAAAIVLLSIAAAVVYGVLHDQITARVCVEYFTIGHPDLFGTDSPTLLALGWGVVATWWAGLLTGIPLAIAARVGPRPKRSARSLLVPMAKLLGIMAACAALAGLLGFALAMLGQIQLIGLMSALVSAQKQSCFLADLWAHRASYTAGFIGGAGLALKVWWSRTLPRKQQMSSSPTITTIGIAVVEHSQQFLVGTRGPSVSLAGYAEFPGGKCLPGESPDACAVRECLEETGLAVVTDRLLLRREYVYPHATVDLHFFLCHPSAEDSVQDQHQGFRWVPREQLASLKFPEANEPLIEMLVKANE